MFAHIRPIFIAFLGVVAGLLLAEWLFSFNMPFFLITFFVVCFLLFCFAFFFKKFDQNKFLGWLYRVKWATLTVIVSASLGVGLFFLDYARIDNSGQKVDVNTSYYIVGTVQQTPTYYDEYATFFVGKAVASFEEEQHVFTHNIYVKLYYYDENYSKLENLKKGDAVLFKAKLSAVDVYSNKGLYTYALKQDFRHVAYGKLSSFEVSSVSEPTLVQSVQQKIKDTLFANMDEKYAAIAYGIFLGDTTYIDQEVISNFKISGVAHLLAVSGLNVGFIVVLLMWLLRLCRAKPWVKILVISVVLIMYCILCDMAISVVRATIMALFLLLGHVFGKQTDALNSVSLAGILILLVCPWQVFDVSFVLSFAAVYGIIFLGPKLNDFFLRCHLGKFVSGTLSISLASQIATTPFMVQYFGYISSYSLFANFLIVPFLGYVYMAMFLALIVVLVLPFMGWTLWLLQWGYWVLDVVTNWIASIPFAVFNIPKIFNIVILVWMFVMFMCSYYNVLNTKQRRITQWASVLFLVALCTVNLLVVDTSAVIRSDLL